MKYRMAQASILFVSGILAGMNTYAEVQKNDPVHTFTKKDGTKIVAQIDKYSTSSQMFRAKLVDTGEYIDLSFSEISPENQQIILDWKMNEIVQSSNFRVEYTRVKDAKDSEYIRGTDIKVDDLNYHHELTLINKERIPITGLTVQYAIAYERKETEGRGMRDPQSGLGYRAALLPLIDLDSKSEQTITTPVIALKSFEDVEDDRRTSRNYYDDGGSSKESYEGVIFRFLRNGVLLREEASPPSLAKRNFEFKPEEKIPTQAK